MKISTLVDTNVLIDILGPAELETRRWSLAALKHAFGEGPIVFSAIVWAELSKPSLGEEALSQAFAWLRPLREDFPFDAAFSAGAAHTYYRLRGGKRERTLPDFLIGAHAMVAGHRLLTRDAGRYRSYFPHLNILSPETYALEDE
ncbi:type II toxin-antitoxin system VapC family toxin [Pseudaminobacter arsenicus]|uniref:Ribonuclease VapC n=1 Tax=Borborobacter arsenicus TaxID=1851146 RepID=A0A432V8P8_9HYPH|nr:type II toxin-antitoxin system VapC family toxin [Pseudaminobacter arsenicus]RUM98443.1 type II toxin-antitoxin system VapC family toxin [Pseudaminobacter arsenicus]